VDSCESREWAGGWAEQRPRPLLSPIGSPWQPRFDFDRSLASSVPLAGAYSNPRVQEEIARLHKLTNAK
jgi:hypothetical protein